MKGGVLRLVRLRPAWCQDHISLLGGVTVLAFQSPGLSKHSSVTLCSSPSALGRSRWHVSTFSSLFDYWSCKPGLQACMQLVGSGYYSKLIFIIFILPCRWVVAFLLGKKMCHVFSLFLLLVKLSTLILIKSSMVETRMWRQKFFPLTVSTQ